MLNHYSKKYYVRYLSKNYVLNNFCVLKYTNLFTRIGTVYCGVTKSTSNSEAGIEHSCFWWYESIDHTDENMYSKSHLQTLKFAP